MNKLIKQISGIYKIICCNNKFYIGSSVNIDKRLKEHTGLLKRNKHPNKYLQNAWNKYRDKNFKYEIIETIHDVSQLLAREKWWLDKTNCCNRKIGFNVSHDPYEINNGKKIFIDLTGQNFGLLTAIRPSEYGRYIRTKWLCLCECGKEISVRMDRLRSGNTKSCGCLHKECAQKQGKLNRSHGYCGTKTYHIWNSLRQRCNNKNHPSYGDYGGRGITVCDRWNISKGGSFENFLLDMGECPEGCELGKINNDDGYYKENCRWTTKKINARNKRNNHLLKYDNRELCFAEWEEITGIKQSIISKRIKRGWSIEKALTTPVRKR